MSSVNPYIKEICKSIKLIFKMENNVKGIIFHLNMFWSLYN